MIQWKEPHLGQPRLLTMAVSHSCLRQPWARKCCLPLIPQPMLASSSSSHSSLSRCQVWHQVVCLKCQECQLDSQRWTPWWWCSNKWCSRWCKVGKCRKSRCNSWCSSKWWCKWWCSLLWRGQVALNYLACLVWITQRWAVELTHQTCSHLLDRLKRPLARPGTLLRCRTWRTILSLHMANHRRFLLCHKLCLLRHRSSRCNSLMPTTTTILWCSKICSIHLTHMRPG